MKTLLIYDSLYGNTKLLAETIRDAIPGEVKLVHANEVDPTEISEYDLLIIGAPTHSAGPSPTTKNLLQRIDRSIIKGKPIATFDTRLTESAFDKKWLSKLVFAMGFAAPKIARDLKQKGAQIVGKPGDFYVTGGEGPLKDGEIERATIWAQQIGELGARKHS